MVRPTKLPNWADAAVVGDIVEPTEVKKSAGWEKVGGIPEKPPYQYFNYWQNSVYNWVNYLDAAVTAFATQDLTLRLDTPTLGQTLAIGDVNAAIINIGKTAGAVNILGTLKSSSILLTCALAGITTVARANSANANAVTIPDFATNTLASANNAQTFTGLQTFTDSVKLLNKAAAANTISWQTGNIFSFGTGATISETGVSVFNTSVSSPSILVSCAATGVSTITRANTVTAYALTLPSANSALAALDIAQTFSLVNTFSAVPIFSLGIQVTSSGGTSGAGKITRNGTSWEFGGINSTITESGAFSGVTGVFNTSVTSKLLIVSDAGTAASGRISANSLVFQFGGTTSTISEAGAFAGTTGAFTSSVTTPTVTNTVLALNSTTTTITATSKTVLNLFAGTTFLLKTGNDTSSVNAIAGTAVGALTFGPVSTTIEHIINGRAKINNTTGAILSVTTGTNLGSAGTPLKMRVDFLGYSDLLRGSIYAIDQSADSANGGLFFEVSTTANAILAAGNISGLAAWTLGTGAGQNHVLLGTARITNQTADATACNSTLSITSGSSYGITGQRKTMEIKFLGSPADAQVARIYSYDERGSSKFGGLNFEVWNGSSILPSGGINSSSNWIIGGATTARHQILGKPLVLPDSATLHDSIMIGGPSAALGNAVGISFFIPNSYYGVDYTKIGAYVRAESQDGGSMATKLMFGTASGSAMATEKGSCDYLGAWAWGVNAVGSLHTMNGFLSMNGTGASGTATTQHPYLACKKIIGTLSGAGLATYVMPSGVPKYAIAKVGAAGYIMPMYTSAATSGYVTVAGSTVTLQTGSTFFSAGYELYIYYEAA